MKNKYTLNGWEQRGRKLTDTAENVTVVWKGDGDKTCVRKYDTLADVPTKLSKGKEGRIKEIWVGNERRTGYACLSVRSKATAEMLQNAYNPSLKRGDWVTCYCLGKAVELKKALGTKKSEIKWFVSVDKFVAVQKAQPRIKSLTDSTMARFQKQIEDLKKEVADLKSPGGEIANAHIDEMELDPDNDYEQDSL